MEAAHIVGGISRAAGDKFYSAVGTAAGDREPADRPAIDFYAAGASFADAAYAELGLPSQAAKRNRIPQGGYRRHAVLPLPTRFILKPIN